MRLPKAKVRWGVRTLLLVVFICAAVFGCLRWRVDSYREDWEVEQRALREMRGSGANLGVSTITLGPRWLRSLVGSERSKYFDRVDRLFFVASDAKLATKYRESFKHLRVIFQD